MSTALAPLPAQAPAPAARWTTPRVLKTSRTVLIALNALLLIAAVTGTGTQRDAMKTVGKDAAPSIIHAQEIKSAMADMDADAANELLLASNDISTYDKRREDAAEALISAAENITYGDAERAPIKTLQLGLGDYEKAIQQARDRRADSADAITAYRTAHGIMDGTLLPAADALDKANNDQLEKTYLQQSTDGMEARAGVAVAGLLVLAALLALQMYLSRRTRRTLNPLLALATLIAIVVTVHNLYAMQSSQTDLKVAKEDAFTSLHALGQARAVAYDANSEESRYLLDPATASNAEGKFFRDADLLVALSGSTTPRQLIAEVSQGAKVQGFTGYLADELNNITFSGEQEAAVKTLSWWESYLTIDTQIRQLERTHQSAQHALAIQVDTDRKLGGSEYAFQQFDDALGTALAINRKAFDENVEDGLSVLHGLEWEAAVATVLMAVLVFLGLAPRIREYE